MMEGFFQYLVWEMLWLRSLSITQPAWSTLYNRERSQLCVQENVTSKKEQEQKEQYAIAFSELVTNIIETTNSRAGPCTFSWKRIIKVEMCCWPYTVILALLWWKQIKHVMPLTIIHKEMLTYKWTFEKTLERNNMEKATP